MPTTDQTLAGVICGAVEDQKEAALIVQLLIDHKLVSLPVLSKMSYKQLGKLLDMANIHPVYYDVVKTALSMFTKDGSTTTQAGNKSTTAATAAQATIDFWSLLPKATLTKEEKSSHKGKKKAGKGDAEESTQQGGTFLDLEPGTFFVGDEKLGSKLFVRECYQELAEVTMGVIESGYNLVITGNPGIGKSFFLFFFMHFLCAQEKKNPTIVLYRHLEKRWYLFSKGEVLATEKADGPSAFRKYLDDPNTWYLVDTAQPLQVKAKTLLVCSPYVERYKEYLKTTAELRFMPIWSKEEIDICRKAFYDYPGERYVSQDQVNDLFTRWGGIPRYVLEKANSERAQTDLEVAISKCTTKDIITYTGSEGVPEHVSHKLIHMMVQRDPPQSSSKQSERYSVYKIDVASDYVATQLIEKFGSDVTHHLAILRTLEYRRDAPILFGHLYEGFAHKVISEGGEFRTRNLQTGDESELHVTKKTVKHLENVKDLLKLGELDYGKGHNTFPALDGATADPPALFNMTTALNRKPMTGTALTSALDHLQEDRFLRPVPFHWVVPTNRFDAFKKPAVDGMRTKAVDELLDQFVMELSISESTSITNNTKKRTLSRSGTKDNVCSATVASGPRKGQLCGHPNPCRFHSKKSKR